MKIKINYEIDAKIIESIRKITMNINDVSMKGDFNLSEKDVENIHDFNDFTHLIDDLKEAKK